MIDFAIIFHTFGSFCRTSLESEAFKYPSRCCFSRKLFNNVVQLGTLSLVGRPPLCARNSNPGIQNLEKSFPSPTPLNQSQNKPQQKSTIKQNAGRIVVQTLCAWVQTFRIQFKNVSFLIRNHCALGIIKFKKIYFQTESVKWLKKNLKMGFWV